MSIRRTDHALVLVIEDQEKLRRNLSQDLAAHGYEVVAVGTGEEGYERATSERFDALVLDLKLPARDGLSILTDLRQAGFASPVLILTAQGSVEERVKGLDAGADDYLVKPFAHAELLARLRAMLRRSSPVKELVLRCGDLAMDVVARRVERAGVALELTVREFELLEYLLRHKNSHVTREMLARDVWNEPAGVMTNVIDVCINSLRRKIEQADQPTIIHTVRGVGYAVRDLQA